MKHGDMLVLIPDDVPIPPSRVFYAGVPLGECLKGRFQPHHAFFSAYGDRFARTLDLRADDCRLAAYLHGETVAVKGLSDGFCAVTVDGIALGGGKVVGGILKNYYPKGLRTPTL